MQSVWWNKGNQWRTLDRKEAKPKTSYSSTRGIGPQRVWSAHTARGNFYTCTLYCYICMMFTHSMIYAWLFCMFNLSILTGGINCTRCIECTEWGMTGRWKASHFHIRPIFNPQWVEWKTDSAFSKAMGFLAKGTIAEVKEAFILHPKHFR